MAIRAKSAADPAAVHFKASEETMRLVPGEGDARQMGPPYRRSIVEVTATEGDTVNHRTLWFAGARSGFLSNTTDGVVTINRTAEDIAADGVDGLGINLVIGGHIRVQSGHRDETFGAGDLFLEDSGVPRTAISGLNPGGLIYIPRERFLEALPVPIDQINLLRLTDAPLAPALSQQIAFLVRNFNQVSPDEFEAVLEAAIEISIVLLRRHIALSIPPEDPLRAAARAYIASHFRETDLTPASLAKALGCSRAVLYRAFANTDHTVVRYIRDVRFRHFLDALRAQPEASISQLAYESGFANSPSDFTKLFKRTYGLPPSQAQAAIWRR